MAAKAHPIFNNFTAGEWSPRLTGRVDLGKYFNACETLENFILQPQGGATGRPGTHFVAEVKDSTDLTRLIPVRFSSEQAYIIELGEYYARFYKDNGRIEETGVPVEIVTPWTAAEVWELHYAQNADTLFLVHPDHYPQQLVRYSHTVWRLGNVPFNPVPTYEYGTRSTTYLVPEAVSGTNVQFDTGADIFLASDVGREVVGGTGRATITVVDSASRVHADITSAFGSTDQIPAGDWSITISPQAECRVISNYIAYAPPVGLAVDFVSGADAFRAEDVGKIIRIYGGTLEITAYVSPTALTAVVTTEIFGQPDSNGWMPLINAGAWSIEESAWSSLLGYPKSVGWFQGRLIFAGTDTQPRTWWMSSALDVFNFLIGSNDSDAMEWTVDSSEMNAIQWVAQSDALLLGTAGAAFAASGGNDSAITPTNTPLVSQFTNAKCSSMQPVQAWDTILFLTSSGKKLLEALYRLEKNGYTAPNLLLLANHLTETHLTDWITDMAYQAEPDGVVWAVRSDGELVACTYLRDQEIIGWHRHTTDGNFESVAVIPEPDLLYDQVWVIVKRTIDGAEKRYVEYFDASWDVFDGEATGLHTDCALTYDGAATTTVTGADHLEGKTVRVIGDGCVYPNATVTGGGVTLNGPAAEQIEVGLSFTPTLTTMRPEVQIAGGTSQGFPKSWSNLNVRFMNTMGAEVNGETIPWRAAGDATDEPVPLYTGDKQVTPLGWDNDGRVTVTQSNPLPITVLAIFGNLLVGD